MTRSAVPPMLAASACAAAAQVCFRHAAAGLGDLRDLPTSGAVWLGVAFYAASLPLSLLGYQRGDLLVAFPLLSLAYVWTAIAGVALFDEDLGLRRAVAIALLVAGAGVLGSRS